MISNKSNAVKILPKIENKDSYIKIYTNVNNYYEVGDKVYICSYDVNDVNSDLDNYLYYLKNSGETVQGIYYLNIDGEIYLQGYDILEIDSNNGIVLNRKITSISDQNNLTPDNFFISKTYIMNGLINPTTTTISVNGAIFKSVNLSGETKGDINWVQGIILGGNITNMKITDKYYHSYLTTNTQLDINNNIISNYTFNNNGYGFSIFSGNTTTPIFFFDTNFDNGYFYNCTINGYSNNNPENFENINSGYFSNSNIYKNFKINNGYFYKTSIYSLETIWNNGTFDPVDSSTIFTPIIWNNGIWNSYNTPPNLIWYNGRFNGNTFSNTCIWKNGNFNGDVFEGSVWNTGSFNKGVFNALVWDNGEFNNGTFSSGVTSSLWKNGTFYNGTFTGRWITGNFLDGDFNGTEWSGGTFNGGYFNTGNWHGGDFINGNFNGDNWFNGYFYGGIFTESKWWYGTFYNGDIINTIWYDGIFKFGRLFSVTWKNGTFYNGISTNTDFVQVDWKNGVFNSGNFGTIDTITPIYWKDGSFNNGVFSSGGTFINGVFYDGIFKGTWNNSGNNIFYKGDYSSAVVPPSNPINREYIPYQKEQIVRKLNKQIRPRNVLGIRKIYS
jgi:hypothetical protein